MKRWSPADDGVLRSGFAAGRTSSDIAAELGRTPDAIRKRAERIGVRSNYIASVTKPHGLSAYRRRGCRCDECRRANTDACVPFIRAFRQRKKGTPPPKHGYYGYNAYGCRCDVCVEAKRAYERDYYRRRKAVVL